MSAKKSRSVNVRLDEELYRCVERAAQDDGRAVSQWIRWKIIKALRQLRRTRPYEKIRQETHLRVERLRLKMAVQCCRKCGRVLHFRNRSGFCRHCQRAFGLPILRSFLAQSLGGNDPFRETESAEEWSS